MFKDSIIHAKQSSFPILLVSFINSQRDNVNYTKGTCFKINDEYFLSVNHFFEKLHEIKASYLKYSEYKKIESDDTLDPEDKIRRLSLLEVPDSNSIIKYKLEIVGVGKIDEESIIRDCDKDISAFKCIESNTIPHLKIQESSQVSIGDACVIIGYPDLEIIFPRINNNEITYNLSNFYIFPTFGFIAAHFDKFTIGNSRTLVNRKNYMLSNVSKMGQSGGPVLNTKGELVGLQQSSSTRNLFYRGRELDVNKKLTGTTIQQFQNVALMLDVEEITLFLEQHSIEHHID